LRVKRGEKRLNVGPWEPENAKVRKNCDTMMPGNLYFLKR